MRRRLDRWWWTATGIVLIIWALQIYPSVNQVPIAAAAVVIFALWGLATIVASVTPTVPVAPDGSSGAHGRHEQRVSTVWDRFESWSHGKGAHFAALAFPWITAGMVVAAFIVWSILQVHAGPGYGTDEMAFNQYAAMLAHHGHNPYTHSMAPSFSLFQVSPNGYTFNLNGTPVTALSYPALSFEVYLPFLALGWSTQLAVAVNVLAWSLSILLLFALLPRRLRASALVIGSLSTYVGFAVGGVTDAVFVPLLIGAAYHWYRFAYRRGPVAWIGPILFGLAMSVKQTPWFLLPFVLAGIAGQVRIEKGRWGIATAARYFAIALAAFSVPNLPYIVTAPSAWFHGVLTPFSSDTVPAGQGLIGLSLFLRIGGGSLVRYAITTVVVLIVLWVVYVASFPRLRTWTFVIPSLALFFAARSFSSYLVMLAPLALLAAATDDDFGDASLLRSSSGAPDSGGGGRDAALIAAESDDAELGALLTQDGPDEDETVAPQADVIDPPPWRHWPILALAGGILIVICVIASLTSSAPLSVKITGIRTTGQLATIERISVSVHNNTDAPLRPSFSVQEGGVISAFWQAIGHSKTIGAHRSVSYNLLSPNFSAQPALGGGFAVAAFTQSPASVSTSPDVPPAQWHLGISPDSVARVIPVGQAVTLRAQILNQFNRPVHVADVGVFLGQIIYGQQGLSYGKAAVNGSAPGTTPVIGLSNPNGEVTFVIKGSVSLSVPVYFEANLFNNHGGYAYGYSEIVPIRFGPAH